MSPPYVHNDLNQCIQNCGIDICSIYIQTLIDYQEPHFLRGQHIMPELIKYHLTENPMDKFEVTNFG